MLPMLTAIKVYWLSAGTIGHSTSADCVVVGLTLFKRASELRNEGWFNSMENEGSSWAVVSHEIVERRPDVTLVGVSIVKPRAKGRAAARMQSLANIFLFGRYRTF